MRTSAISHTVEREIHFRNHHRSLCRNRQTGKKGGNEFNVDNLSGNSWDKFANNR